MNSPLNNDPAPDFNDPLGLLMACHQRMLGFCDLLEKITVHIDQHGIDTEVKQSAQKIHRYFSTAGMLHHQDEEQDLFPLLVGTSLKMATIIHELKQDHAKIDTLWQKLSASLARPASIADNADFKRWVSEFCDAYRQHIQKEEDDFLSMAQHLLSSEQLQQLGKNMRERRERF